MCAVAAVPWEDFAVDPIDNQQSAPDIHNNKIVWQEYVTIGKYSDWDIYLADITDLESPAVFVVSEEVDDQQMPVIYDNLVAWQDFYWGDWDIYCADVSNLPNVVEYPLTPYDLDQKAPAVSGDVVVWEDYTLELEDDIDIYGTDVSDIAEPNTFIEFLVTPFADNQTGPAVYRNTVVWEDDYSGTGHDIYGADIWRRFYPADFEAALFEQEQRNCAVSGDMVVWQMDFGAGDWDIYAARIKNSESVSTFAIASETLAQKNPDIDGHIIVWQDYRNGDDYNIWGYNLVTGQEFQITDDPFDQINPAISNDIVVWEDYRDDPSNIYAVILKGVEIAACPDAPAGDINGDCKANMLDLALLAEEWLTCGLEPQEACQ